MNPCCSSLIADFSSHCENLSYYFSDKIAEIQTELHAATETEPWGTNTVFPCLPYSQYQLLHRGTKAASFHNLSLAFLDGESQ